MLRLKLSRPLFFILGLYCSLLTAQNYSKECELADRLFPNADVVVLRKDYHLNIVPKGDTIKFYSTNKKVNYIRKNSKIHSSESIYYSAEFSGITDLMAYTIDPATNKKTKFSGSAEGSYYSSNIFYDDNREVYFVYPDIKDKSVTEMEYTMNYSEPRLIPPYYFSFHEPVLRSTITVTLPQDCELGWIVKDQGAYNIVMNKVAKGNIMEYTWTLGESEILGDLRKNVSASKILPHVIFWIKKYTTKKGERRVLGDVNDLYKWYSGFIKRAQTKDTMVVKNLADSITKNCSNSVEKVKAIFGWVQQNISYVAFEDGYSGFIPRKADMVIQKKYGDCKDMANLLVELMKNCGLDSRHVWIGTRDIPYSYHEVYTPIVDNHMIAAVMLDDKLQFLDATGKFMPLGFPTSMIQDKIALVELNSENFEFARVEVLNSSDNRTVDSVVLNISGEKLLGSGKYKLTGYPMIGSKIELSYTTTDTEKKYYKEMLLKGNNKFKLINYQLLKPTSDNNQMIVDYNFEIDNYISLDRGDVYVNLNIGKTDLVVLEPQKINPEAFSSNDYKYVKEEHFILTIPEGYNVKFIPPDNKIEQGFINYTSAYSRVGNELVLYRKLMVDYLELNKDQLLKYNSIVSEIQKTERSNVLLSTN